MRLNTFINDTEKDKRQIHDEKKRENKQNCHDSVKSDDKIQ